MCKSSPRCPSDETPAVTPGIPEKGFKKDVLALELVLDQLCVSDTYSQELKTLMDSMRKENPEERPSIQVLLENELFPFNILESKNPIQFRKKSIKKGRCG